MTAHCAPGAATYAPDRARQPWANPNVSIIIVSRGRPHDLRRCLLGISQLFYHPFEVVVVVDSRSHPSLAEWSGRFKSVPFETPNISAARNAGLDQAAGDIIAFIDDDAVPEPSWLDHLVAPFANPDVAAAGGWVRGRNGISFQNQSRLVDRNAQHQALPYPATATRLCVGTAESAPRTEGTNMAWRRTTLAALGGFNAAYHFYLDETDLNLRLAQTGGTTALVPRAQVHHGFAASDFRSAKRVPRDLTQIGASLAAFLTRYAPDPRAALAAARREQTIRMQRLALRGDVWPGAVRQRLAEFDAGAVDGAQRTDVFWSPKTPPPFLAWSDVAPKRGSVAIASGWRGRLGALEAAMAARQAGDAVSLLRLSHTSLFHHVRFEDAGYWLQTGGIYGRSDRDMRLFTPTTLRSRAVAEVAKVSGLREIKSTEFIGA